MTAAVRVASRSDPLRVTVLPDRSSPMAPIRLSTGSDVVAMMPEEARALAGALLTAAAFEPSKVLRRPADINERTRGSDHA